MSSEAIPEGWVVSPLYALADYINGRPTKPTEVTASGVPVIKIAELNGGITKTTDRVPRESIKDHHWVRSGDLLFAWSGSVGVHVYDGELAALNQHIFRVESANGVDQSFLRYLLEAQMKRFEAQVADKRTTMGHITVADLKRMTVALPPLDEQRRIASVLGTLDQQVSNERDLARTCRALVSTLFEKEFLVASAEWPAASLTDIARFVNGRNFTKSATGEGRPVVRIKELRSGLSRSTVWNEVETGPDHVVAADELLFAWSGTLCVSRWPGPEGLINQHIFKVVPTDDWPLWFVEGWVNHHLHRFQHIAAAKATTMGHIKRGDLTASEVRLPPAQVLSRFGPSLQGLSSRAASATQTALTASALREAFLPKLLAGEIRVPDTQLAVESETPAVGRAA